MKALQIFIILGYIRIVAYSTLANFAYFFHPWITGNAWSFDRKGVKSNGTQNYAINCSLQTCLENFSFPHRIQCLTIYWFFTSVFMSFYRVLYSSIDIVMRRRSICRRRIKQ
jgi:hypothetical protein